MSPSLPEPMMLFPLADELVIAHVLRHHVGHAGALDGVHETGAVFERVGGGHFAQDVFAVLHGDDRLIDVERHRRGNDDDIHRAVEEGVEVGVAGLRRHAEGFAGVGEGGRVGVTERRDLRFRVELEGRYEAGAAACADQTDAIGFHVSSDQR